MKPAYYNEIEPFAAQNGTATKQEPEFTIIAFGSGVNSTAIICGMIERGARPVDLILFADTGGEKPHTYFYIGVMNKFLAKHGWPAIQTVRKTKRNQQPYPLEDHCLDKKSLPSLAYGWKSCSHKFKIEPQEKYTNNYPPAKAFLKAGGKIRKLIGYDYGETNRWQSAKREDKKYKYIFPLVDWRYYREDCEAVIARAGLPSPGKSACFFCPASKKAEITDLVERYPELAKRALKIEKLALPGLTTVKGLGRRFAWKDHVAGLPVPETNVEQDCMCFDGGDD